MTKVKQVKAEDQKAEGYSGDANGWVSAEIKWAHVLLHFLILFFFLHQLLYFFFLQWRFVVDFSDEVENLCSFGDSTFP